MVETNLEDVPVAILAGGLATRLRPLTEKIPKVLLPVAGKPFLAHQLELLKSQGIRKVVLCLGYLGEMVVEEFGDGSKRGMQLGYSHDGPRLLGTGGALRQACPLLGDTFFVLYGDSYLTTPFAPIARAFANSGKPGLMTVYRNEGRFDRSNVVFRDGQIVVYDKKSQRPDMQYIDYGLSMLRRSAIERWPIGQSFDLAEVMQDLVSKASLAGFEVGERFYEIGSPEGLVELEQKLR